MGQFAAQAADLAVDGAVTDITVGGGGQVDQALAGQQGVGMLEEHLQQPAFGGAQLDRRAACAGQQCADGAEVPAGEAVAAAGRRHGGLAAALAAQHAVDARHQLTGFEGLGDVVVGAQVQAANAVGGGIAGGQQDHRGVAAPMQLVAQLKTVAIG